MTQWLFSKLKALEAAFFESFLHKCKRRLHEISQPNDKI